MKYGGTRNRRRDPCFNLILRLGLFELSDLGKHKSFKETALAISCPWWSRDGMYMGDFSLTQVCFSRNSSFAEWLSPKDLFPLRFLDKLQPDHASPELLVRDHWWYMSLPPHLSWVPCFPHLSVCKNALEAIQGVHTSYEMQRFTQTACVRDVWFQKAARCVHLFVSLSLWRIHAQPPPLASFLLSLNYPRFQMFCTLSHLFHIATLTVEKWQCAFLSVSSLLWSCWGTSSLVIRFHCLHFFLAGVKDFLSQFAF